MSLLPFPARTLSTSKLKKRYVLYYVNSSSSQSFISPKSLPLRLLRKKKDRWNLAPLHRHHLNLSFNLDLVLRPQFLSSLTTLRRRFWYLLAKARSPLLLIVARRKLLRLRRLLRKLRPVKLLRARVKAKGRLVQIEVCLLHQSSSSYLTSKLDSSCFHSRT